MHAWLEADYGLDVVAASHLMGQTVGFDVANVFNPAYTVVCRMPVSVVEESRDREGLGLEGRRKRRSNLQNGNTPRYWRCRSALAADLERISRFHGIARPDCIGGFIRLRIGTEHRDAIGTLGFEHV